MNRREVLLTILASALPLSRGRAQITEETKIPAGPAVARWLTIAEALKPTLAETIGPPLAVVQPVPNHSLPLRYRMDVIGPAGALDERVLHKGESFIVDFGHHLTGYLSFTLTPADEKRDFPVRLRLTFGEIPPDVAEPLYPYTGSISEAWLPDEIINVDDLPQAVRISRRYAFRYVKIEVVDTNLDYGMRITDLRARAVTAAKKVPLPLPIGTSPLLRRIDEVAIATLRDCLQTVFEDGPRRDRRLWLGDLRLEALSNYATFRANDVVKRCLYLFAAFPRADGLVNACVYEHPRPKAGSVFMMDYAALFTVAVADYVEATGDLATGHDLWPVVARQLEILGRTVSADGVFVDPKNMIIFIDWKEDLDRTASMHGVLTYAFKRTYDLATQLGRVSEVKDYPARVIHMGEGARRAWFDNRRGVFTSGPDRQVSWASQAWLCSAGAARSKTEAQKALVTAMHDPHAIRPATPYLYHYVVDAMLNCGMRKEARQLVEDYWGGMINAGADTFWEVYDPNNPLASPYGDIHINSYCHAWSCTPSYFIRRRGLAD